MTTSFGPKVIWKNLFIVLFQLTFLSWLIDFNYNTTMSNDNDSGHNHPERHPGPPLQAAVIRVETGATQNNRMALTRGLHHMKELNHLEQPWVTDSPEMWAQFMHWCLYQWQAHPGLILNWYGVYLLHLKNSSSCVNKFPLCLPKDKKLDFISGLLIMKCSWFLACTAAVMCNWSHYIDTLWTTAHIEYDWQHDHRRHCLTPCSPRHLWSQSQKCTSLRCRVAHDQVYLSLYLEAQGSLHCLSAVEATYWLLTRGHSSGKWTQTVGCPSRS